MKKLLAIGTVLLLGLLAMAALASEPKVKVGTQAPDFSLRDLDGNLIRLGDMAYQGDEVTWRKKKRILMDFFRTDCEPCMHELPQVIDFHNKHKDEVQVIMIALLESEQGREKLDAFLQKHKLPFPVLVDSYETVAKKYIVDGETVTLPSIFFLDKNGMVRARFVGLKEDLDESIQKILASQTTMKD